MCLLPLGMCTPCQARIEEEEEFIANNLLRRLETAKKEKEHLALQVENEEDFLTNTLQKRLEQVPPDPAQRHFPFQSAC